MRTCLNEHTADLSDACKTSMAAHDAKAKEMQKSAQGYPIQRRAAHFCKELASARRAFKCHGRLSASPLRAVCYVFYERQTRSKRAETCDDVEHFVVIHGYGCICSSWLASSSFPFGSCSEPRHPLAPPCVTHC